jgi:hypothetical protein
MVRSRALIERIKLAISARVPRFTLHPAFQLTALGLLSWVFYFHLSSSYPLATLVAKNVVNDFARINNYSVASMYDFLLSLAVPLAAYFVAWKILQNRSFDRRLLAIIFGFAVIFAATFVAIYPIGATDLFDYVFYSRIFVHYGQNPLAVPPITFRNDPFLRTVVWYKTPSPYGPLWILLTAPGSLIAGDDLTLNLSLMAELPTLFYFACAVVIALILRNSDPGHLLAGTLLFAWNPLVVFEVLANGHNGIIMMFFVLLAIYLLVRKKWVWVLPALLASVLIKYISAILVLPFLIYCWRAQPDRRARWRFLAITAAISLVLGTVIALPFLSLPSGLLDEANWYSLLAIPTLAFHSLKDMYGENDAKTIVVASSSLAYLILYFFSLRYIPMESKPRRLVLLCTWLTTAYLAVACVYFQPWFVKWVVALGIWANHKIVRRVVLTFTASALASYAVSYYWVWNWVKWTRLETNTIFVAVIFGPPLLVGLLSLARAYLPPWLAAASARRQLALSQEG